jgi:hypothetical protein
VRQVRERSTSSDPLDVPERVRWPAIALPSLGIVLGVLGLVVSWAGARIPGFVEWPLSSAAAVVLGYTGAGLIVIGMVRVAWTALLRCREYDRVYRHSQWAAGELLIAQTRIMHLSAAIGSLVPLGGRNAFEIKGAAVRENRVELRLSSNQADSPFVGQTVLIMGREDWRHMATARVTTAAGGVVRATVDESTADKLWLGYIRQEVRLQRPIETTAVAILVMGEESET